MAYAFFLHAESTEYGTERPKAYTPDWAEFGRTLAKVYTVYIPDDDPEPREVLTWLDEQSISYSICHRSKIERQDLCPINAPLAGIFDPYMYIVYEAFSVHVYRKADAALLRMKYPSLPRNFEDCLNDVFGGA